MGMGYSACNAIVIEESEIKKLNIDSFEIFLSILNQFNVTLDQLAQAEDYGEDLSEITDTVLEEDQEKISLFMINLNKILNSKLVLVLV